jgi:hypothetical protein
VTHHLKQLTHALNALDITVVHDVDQNGGSYQALQVAGVPGKIMCRTNPTDAHHYWYWCGPEPLHPAHGVQEAREAAEKIQQRRRQGTAAPRSVR